MPSDAVGRIVHTNPASDGLFRAQAEVALRDGPLTAQELECRLRGRYPNVRVDYRGLADEPDGFYLFRDGHWTRDVAERAEAGGAVHATEDDASQGSDPE